MISRKSADATAQSDRRHGPLTIVEAGTLPQLQPEEVLYFDFSQCQAINNPGVIPCLITLRIFNTHTSGSTTYRLGRKE